MLARLWRRNRNTFALNIVFVKYASDEGLIFSIYKKLKYMYKQKQKSPLISWQRTWTKEDTHSQWWKKCWTSVIIRGMQIKTTMKYHLMPVRMAIIKKSRNNRCWWGCGEKGMLLHYWWECKLVQLLWKIVWRFLKDLEIEIPFDSAIPLQGIYPKDYKSCYYKDTCTCINIQ